MKKTDSSKPIEQFALPSSWIMDYLHFCKKNRPPVQTHKKKLGKQNYCFNNGEFRFWVWEGENWRVYVSNHKGICFEVSEGLASLQDALNAWNDYKKKME